MNYNRIAWVYEQLGYIYSGRQIFNAKASQIGQMCRGDRVLYVGVGPGEDALLAVREGVDVTCLDLSEGMLRRAQSRICGAGFNAEFVCGDVKHHERQGYYDVVVANFFLNVFSESEMRSMLGTLTRLAKPNGKVLISDFMAPDGNFAARAVQATYWGVTNLFYYSIALCAWHPIYDYPRYFDEVGLECQGVRRFRPWGIAPFGFSAITACRRSSAA